MNEFARNRHIPVYTGAHHDVISVWEYLQVLEEVITVILHVCGECIVSTSLVIKVSLASHALVMSFHVTQLRGS